MLASGVFFIEKSGVRIEIVCADAHNIDAVVDYPAAAADGAVEEIENVVGQRKALKTKLCGDNTALGRRNVKAVAVCGSELYAATPVKDHAVNIVGKIGQAHSVEHHVANGKLT